MSIFSRFCIVFIVAQLLVGCVTSEKSVFTKKADEKKAVEYAAQLSRKYISEGNWEAAKRHLKAAVEIDDNNAEIHEALALVFQNTGEIDLAEDHYKKSIALDPTLSRARLNYAAYLYSQQRFQKAADELEIVVQDKLYASRSMAFESLGLCYLNLARPEKAEEAFRRAYLMDRKNPVLMYRLADVYYRLADYPKSKKYYDGYRQQVKVQAPSGLWLGIRLANQFDDKNTLASYALVLKNLYPDSQEYLEYKKEFDK